MGDRVTAPLPKVYLFPANPWGSGDLEMLALCEDGEVVARHICSNPGWGRHDLHDVVWRHPRWVEKFGGWGDGEFYQLVECLNNQVPAVVYELFRRRSAALQADEAGASGG